MKETLEPVVGIGLAIADELEQAQLTVLLPGGDVSGRTQGSGKKDQQHPTVEITERAIFGRSRQRSDMQAARDCRNPPSSDRSGAARAQGRSSQKRAPRGR